MLKVYWSISKIVFKVLFLVAVMLMYLISFKTVFSTGFWLRQGRRLAKTAKSWWDRIKLPARSWAVKAPPLLRSCFPHVFVERGQNSVELALKQM